VDPPGVLDVRPARCRGGVFGAGRPPRGRVTVISAPSPGPSFESLGVGGGPVETGVSPDWIDVGARSGADDRYAGDSTVPTDRSPLDKWRLAARTGSSACHNCQRLRVTLELYHHRSARPHKSTLGRPLWFVCDQCKTRPECGSTY
jgi:hypothetical protein